MIHIDIDDESQDFNMLIQTGKITPWDYENSQIEHEHKKIRQALLLQQKIKEAELYKLKQRKLQMLRQRETQEKRIQQKTRLKSKPKIQHQKEDDGFEL